MLKVHLNLYNAISNCRLFLDETRKDEIQQGLVCGLAHLVGQLNLDNAFCLRLS